MCVLKDLLRPVNTSLSLFKPSTTDIEIPDNPRPPTVISPLDGALRGYGGEGLRKEYFLKEGEERKLTVLRTNPLSFTT